MIKGRQIAWMMYKHFKLSEVDGAMLEWEELLSVELKGDNLQQFENDWGAMCLVVRELPDEKILETIYRKQLDKSDQLKRAMELYWQDITQRGEQKSYEKLKNMLRNHLERKRLDRNKDAWDKDHKTGGGGSKAFAGREAAPSNGPKKGDCRQWAKDGKCSRGDKCPWKGSHTEEKKGDRGRSPSRGRSPGRGKWKGTGKSQER